MTKRARLGITALREALAHPQQEPVAWMTQARNFVHPMEFTEEEAKSYGWKAVYTAPPARKPLTDEQIDAAIKAWFENEIVAGRQPFAKRMRAAIKAANSIKENT